MKKITLLLMAAALCLFTNKANANDGVYFARGNQLVPIHETDIAVAKEVLTISLCDDGFARVDVLYEFLNRGKAKTVDMGFEAIKPYNTTDEMSPDATHPYIYDFTVTMNDEPMAYTNAIVNPGMLDTLFTGPDDDTPEEFVQYAYAYCFKAHFKEGINTVHHTYRYRMSYGVGRTFEVPYWLRPAMRWANHQIDDFTLRIKAENTAKHFCLADSLFKDSQFRIVEGQGKIRMNNFGWNEEFIEIVLRNGTAEWHCMNFRPTADMYIMSADARMSFDKKYKIGSFYDRSDKYYLDWLDRKPDMEIVRNLPYANRGYVFKKKKLRKFFNSMWWYMPDSNYVPSTKDFTPREWRLIAGEKSRL